MSELTDKLRKQTLEAEQQNREALSRDKNRLKLHLMPVTGWMNDPNGLCQMNGTYHVFYQYSPLDVNGGMKVWGHMISEDMVHWTDLEAPFFPDEPFDMSGVYSGCAYVEDGKMYIYYTGNVKHPGDHDYTLTGREANTILIESEDGIHFSPKVLVMDNGDYPDTYTCHIRDPKVWKEDDTYYMVQGGRKKATDGCAGSEDHDTGATLIFASLDLRRWKVAGEVTTENRFGYMWECPDYFEVDGQPVLGASPQGLEHEKFHNQNVYQSGYFVMDAPLIAKLKAAADTQNENSTRPEAGYVQKNAQKHDTVQCVNSTGKQGEIPAVYVQKNTFHEWDMGFDFYAPQTFCDEKGRRILYGWAGIPDADYDNAPTVATGWQHALTLPRELHFRNGKVYQQPVSELETLRKHLTLLGTTDSHVLKNEGYELLIDGKDFGRMELADSAAPTEKVSITYTDHVLSLTLSGNCGRGRDTRRIQIEQLQNLKVIVDTSLIEIYVNDGEYVMTSRFYFSSEEKVLKLAAGKPAQLYELSGVTV